MQNPPQAFIKPRQNYFKVVQQVTGKSTLQLDLAWR